jgi:hypothetical protein
MGLPPELTLLAEDAAVLRENYVPYWGPLHLAGKRLELAPGEPLEFDLLVQGVYVLEDGTSVFLDGTRRDPGEQVELSTGRHTLVLPQGATEQSVRLRLWTAERPHGPPPDQPLYYGL